LQYVLGRWGFRTLDLMVDRRVLVPRPETELVVEVALSELRLIRSCARSALDGSALDEPVVGGPLVADLGTGSGAIALSIAAEAPWAQVWATDASADALAVATANRSSLGLDRRVRLAAGSWYEALPGALRSRLSLIVSNPPYIAEAEVPGLPVVVREWEPKEALVSGPTGLEAIAHVLAGARAWLSAPGSVVVELAPHLADAAMAVARSAGLVEVAVHDDLVGRPRVLVARAA
jgi:release factor glutamine methyltransferase